MINRCASFSRCGWDPGGLQGSQATWNKNEEYKVYISICKPSGLSTDCAGTFLVLPFNNICFLSSKGEVRIDGRLDRQSTPDTGIPCSIKPAPTIIPLSLCRKRSCAWTNLIPTRMRCARKPTVAGTTTHFLRIVNAVIWRACRRNSRNGRCRLSYTGIGRSRHTDRRRKSASEAGTICRLRHNKEKGDKTNEVL
jgi:hypothetical protein